jgi:D-glycero-D-manno-heptose 1,7-bisphosphate phosphatase
LVIFDRDGTLNDNGAGYSFELKQLRVRPEIVQLINSLESLQVNIAIATNQSGVGRKMYDRYQFEAFNEALIARICQSSSSIQLIVACFHLPEESCECRKPKANQIKFALNYFNTKSAIFVGDSQSDAQAAVNARIPWLDINGARSRTSLFDWVNSSRDN